MTQGHADDDEVHMPDGLSLPLQTDSDVAAFDMALKHDADMWKALVMTIMFDVAFIVCLMSTLD